MYISCTLQSLKNQWNKAINEILVFRKLVLNLNRKLVIPLEKVIWCKFLSKNFDWKHYHATEYLQKFYLHEVYVLSELLFEAVFSMIKVCRKDIDTGTEILFDFMLVTKEIRLLFQHNSKKHFLNFGCYRSRSWYRFVTKVKSMVLSLQLFLIITI